MTIDKLKSGSYRIRQMYNGKRYSITVDHKPSKKEATILVADLLQEQIGTAKSGTFEAYAITYIASRAHSISVTTIGGYHVFLRNMPRWWMNTQLYDIDRSLLQQVADEYASNHSPKTVHNMASFCRSVITEYRQNFQAKLSLPKITEPEFYIPTKEEVIRVIDTAEDEYKIPFRLACYGLRKGEICALTLADLDDNNLLHINKSLARSDGGELVIKKPKNASSIRNIFIDAGLADMIREHGSIYDGYPDTILRALHRAQKNADVPKFRFHDFRHFFCTEMAPEISEADLLYLGGWKTDATMKKVYRHSRMEKDDEMKMNAMNIMAQKIGVGN